MMCLNLKIPILFFSLCPFLFLSLDSNAQYEISQQSIFGGAGDDRPIQIVPTNNNTQKGFGYSSTVTFDTNGGYDFWAFELDEALELNWQVHYGSPNDDQLNGFAELNGNYLLVGTIDTMGGTVTEHFGETDAWLVLIDNQGNLLWEKTLGTVGQNEIKKAIPSQDGHFLLVGTTTTDSLMGNGEKDIWLVKIDEQGTVLWEKTYGSSLTDEGIDLLEYPVGTDGIAICGYVRTNDGDVSNHLGSKDMWIAQLDVDGNLLEENVYGGDKADVPSKMVALPDGGLALVGETFSEWEEFGEDKGSGDYLIAVIDEDENTPLYTLWGGTSLDAPKDMIVNEEGNLVVVGESFSMNGDLNFFYLLVDLWFVEISLEGEMIKNVVLGGNKYDTGFSVKETAPNQYLIGGYTDSTDGDLASGKTAPPHGNHFAWAFYLSPFMTSIETIENTKNTNWYFHNNQLIRKGNDFTKAHIQVFSDSGQLLLEKQTQESITDLTQLPFGLYFIEIVEDSKQLTRLKVLID